MILEELITITITTRNRPDDLAFTLERLISLDLAYLPLIIVDDAPDASIVSDEWLKRFPRIQIVRNEVQRGLISNRNKMALLSNTPYVLSLDDDSCFRDVPDLAGAVEYLAQQPRLVALQFNNVDINFGEEAVTESEPYRVQTYTGCGHLLKREIFLEIGGYRADFVHMGEEVEFCRKAWKAGLEVHMYPKIIVDHRRTPVARFPAKNLYYLTRNLVIISYLHLPLAAMMPRLFSNALLSWWQHFRRRYLWSSVFRGWVDGIRYCIAHFPERVPMSGHQYREYRRAPVSR
jgi:glycosyltransferase involved in cell wall biosynthesis